MSPAAAGVASGTSCGRVGTARESLPNSSRQALVSNARWAVPPTAIKLQAAIVCEIVDLMPSPSHRNLPSPRRPPNPADSASRRRHGHDGPCAEVQGGGLSRGRQFADHSKTCRISSISSRSPSRRRSATSIGSTWKRGRHHRDEHVRFDQRGHGRFRPVRSGARSESGRLPFGPRRRRRDEPSHAGQTAIRGGLDRPDEQAAFDRRQRLRPGLSQATFDQMVDTYYEQVAALVEGGVDILLTETAFDTLVLKACLFAIDRYLSRTTFACR